ncbi:hypothetical protein VNI00_016954 [Paramarasmius palmivorus]|uniref:Integral membrane protein n=1 Tax=Paramarasmius palmivorus TaxID=297713 RepID=A0AAW0BAS3_9AGAR
MLLLYALARPIASGLSAASSNDSSCFDPVTSKCIDINKCRTTTGILWSCLSVIFICTWVAIHPNIPRVEDDKGKPWHPAALVYQDVELMIVALLAPEFMILWAMRQREKAKKIGQQFKDYGWGITHGFFVIMGGFALYDGERFCGDLWEGNHYLHEREIAKHHRYMKGAPCYKRRQAAIAREGKPVTSEKPSKLIDKPSDASCLLEFCIAKGYVTLTEDEIKDRSHADPITKSIAIIQTTWFLLQVIARAVKGLAITELEIITVGFAILNFGTYFLWWNKPLRVRHPVRVYWRQTEKSGRNTDGSKGGIWRTCWEGAGAILEYIYALKIFDKGPHNVFIQHLLLPLWIPFHIFAVCERIVEDQDHGSLAITISSQLDDKPLHFYIAVYGIAALFGAIHCIPWGFHFPTPIEQLLWRISAVAVAIAPIAMGLLHGYVNTFWRAFADWKDIIMFTLMIIFSLAYAVFRITLLVIAFTTLRDLSPSAYKTIQWTTFIPHIG